jgi:DNA-directed RNA polymerase specialized sigma24 family protein
MVNEEKDGVDHFDDDLGERSKIIIECIASLGDTCRKILMYHYFDGLSMNEIAERMEFANTDTAKTKKYKCKKRLDELVLSMYSSSDFLE